MSSASTDGVGPTGWERSQRLKQVSREPAHRLRSIASDAAFVSSVCAAHAAYAVIANLRCGAWYVDPTVPAPVRGESYFKSTDGHMHQWSFSLKRANLHLVPLLLAAGGGVVVDATRRGKAMPDALAKTVPIWCAVLNAASKRRYGTPAAVGPGLVTPERSVSRSEHDQILSRLEGWVDSFLGSDLEVPKLEAALRPVFVTQDQPIPTSEAVAEAGTIPLLCVSASRIVPSDQLDPEAQHVYVQGAGDDEEAWARGLTPALFWTHRDEILANPVPQTIDDIVTQSASSRSTATTPVPIGNTRLFIGSPSAHGTGTTAEFAYTHTLSLPQGKKALAHIARSFPPAIEAVTASLAKLPHSSILISTEKDAHVAGALTVAVLAASFDSHQQFIPTPKDRETHRQSLDKQALKRRLEWLVTHAPKAAPPRAHLLRINELLLSQKYRN